MLPLIFCPNFQVVQSRFKQENSRSQNFRLQTAINAWLALVLFFSPLLDLYDVI